LFFPAGNGYRQMRFALDVAYLLDHSSTLLKQIDNALVKRIDLSTTACQPVLRTSGCLRSKPLLSKIIVSGTG
jgi:hypothetical protein